MKKPTLLHFILLLIGLLTIFYLFNSFIYRQKQAEPQNIVPYNAALTGVQVCLPPAEGQEQITLECAFGIKTDVGEYYAIDYSELSHVPPNLDASQRFTAEGRVTPIEMISSDRWRKYNVQGIFQVTKSIRLETSAPLLYEGITPCSSIKPPLPRIQKTVECEMTIWKITIRPDSTYTLIALYGMSQPNTTGIKGGGRQIQMFGTWMLEPGTKTNAKAEVIILTSENSSERVMFQRINENLIHLLDAQKSLMVGHGGWSYTLSRTNNPFGNADLPESPESTLLSGVFEGRTHCHEFFLEFMQTQNDECIKIKWQLTLSPNSYVLKTTRGELQGTWSKQGNIYTLNSDETPLVLKFLRLEDDHFFFLDPEEKLLVGDKLWSYTLSRVR